MAETTDSTCAMLPDAPSDGEWAVWLARLTSEQRLSLRRSLICEPVSGLLDGTEFTEQFRIEVQRARRYSRTVSLVVIRLDQFDAVLSEKGHEVADGLIKHASEVVRRQIRSVDVAGRIANNEIAAMLPETGGMAASMVGSRICNNIMHTQTPWSMAIEDAQRSLSLGVSSFPRDAQDWAELLFWAKTDLEQHPS